MTRIKSTAMVFPLLGCWVLCIGCNTSQAPESPTTLASDRSFEFALLGDNPYPPENVPRFEALIADVNRHSELEWVVHLGDILRPSLVTCSNEMLRARFNLYQGFDAPFVFTPGDNDWFDCWQEAAGGFDEYERLDYLRKLFFPNPRQTTGGRAMEVQSQGSQADFEEFVENAMWTHNDVVFSTVHLVGLTRSPTDPARAERRMDAALAWISETFRLATALESPGVFIATQADPWFVSGLPALVSRRCPDCLQPRPGLERLYPVLEQESLAFGRPVVLAVGDTHVFRVDKPLYSSQTGLLVENFTRVEPFGHPYVHWVRVTVQPDEGAVFAFREEIVDGNVGGAAGL